MRKVCGWLASLLLCFLFAGYGLGAESAPAQDDYPRVAVEMISPAGLGGGYDLTIRSMARCLAETKLVSVPMPVTNIPGGGGALALEYLDEQRGSDRVLAIYSPPLCLIHLNGTTELNYRDNTTPVAQLFNTYGLIAVSKDSRFATLMDVMNALKEDPKALRIGGISAPGSMDHVQFLKVAHAAGVERLDEIEYIGYQDGTAAAQLMGGRVDLISTGLSDSLGLVESGDITALAITSEKRVGGGLLAEIPTCIEQGIDVTFINWRGIFGPKDMPEYALDYWEKVLVQMVETEEWKDLCGKFGWDMEYRSGEDFLLFLDGVNQEYAELLQEIGITDKRSEYEYKQDSSGGYAGIQ